MREIWEGKVSLNDCSNNRLFPHNASSNVSITITDLAGFGSAELMRSKDCDIYEEEKQERCQWRSDTVENR